jgi:hypothetical protein
MVAWTNISCIYGWDFSAGINKALELPGFADAPDEDLKTILG